MQVTKVRTQDFKVKKLIFQEYQANYQLPVYLSLSKADFYSARYHKNRDDLLRSGELSGYTLNQIDELLKEKERYQFLLSALMWCGLFLIFVGFVLWLRLLVLFLASLFQKNQMKYSLFRFVVITILIIFAFSFSKIFSVKQRERISKDYDFEHAMQIALRMDDFYQLVVGDYIEISNLFFEWNSVLDDESKQKILNSLQNKLRKLNEELKKYSDFRSSFIQFDGTELVRGAISVSKSMERVIRSENDQQLRERAVESLKLYQNFLMLLFEKKQMKVSDKALTFFDPQLVQEMASLNNDYWEKSPSVLYYGYFLYQDLLDLTR